MCLTFCMGVHGGLLPTTDVPSIQLTLEILCFIVFQHFPPSITFPALWHSGTLWHISTLSRLFPQLPLTCCTFLHLQYTLCTLPCTLDNLPMHLRHLSLLQPLSFSALVTLFSAAFLCLWQCSALHSCASQTHWAMFPHLTCCPPGVLLHMVSFSCISCIPFLFLGPLATLLVYNVCNYIFTRRILVAFPFVFQFSRSSI